MSTYAEVRVARRTHQCSCGQLIGRGDEYLRDAVPPWALGDFGEGRWIVTKLCYTTTAAV